MRTVELMEIIVQISDYIHDLPLSVDQNDRLVALLVKQLGQAEHDAFLQGFEEGISHGEEIPATSDHQIIYI